MTSNWVTVNARARPFVVNPPNLFELEFNWFEVWHEKLELFKYNLSQLLPHIRDEILQLEVHGGEKVGEFADQVRRLLERRADEVRTPAAGRATRGPRLTRGTPGGRKRRVVNLGFAETSEPLAPLQPMNPLRTDKEYLLWLEVGLPNEGSIEEMPQPLPAELLPRGAVLKIVLYAFEGELKITPGEDIGEIKLNDDGSASVTRQPGVEAVEHAGRRRLFFPVHTPKKEGRARLRCNIYYEQVLVQSRLVTARVMRRPRPSARALRSEVDYTLSQSLGPDLAGRRPHSLSLMLNSNGDGTHAFRFFGREDFKNDATFDGHQLEDWIKQARGAMRRASWGDEEDWKPWKFYLYAGAKSTARLKADLVNFAVRGYKFYDDVVNLLAGGADRAERVERERHLTALMSEPGRVQIALKQSARFVLPAAMIYDYPLDTGADEGDFALCDEFLRASEGEAPLEESACFRGRCPSRGELTVICPSGFWGYRHSIGLPLSLGADRDAASALSWEGELEMSVGVSTDSAFTLREAHEEALRSIRRQLKWNYASTRAGVLRMLKEKRAQLVYFYCHGGVAGRDPYIQVGEKTEKGITRDNLRAAGVRWDETRPLVFINGCQTAALEPGVAFEFISAFVEVAGASGVVGTEITVFEPLARTFAEECLRPFLLGAEIGDAVRAARLKLLKDSNPLGLVYIPYVVADLHLSEESP
jgi:hypothetical protein